MCSQVLLPLALQGWGNVEDKGHTAMRWARQGSDPPLQPRKTGISSALSLPCGGSLSISPSSLDPLLGESGLATRVPLR